jgi:leucine dehydrogenase
MLTIQEISVPDYEKVIEAKDPTRGLHCFIAIHNTSLGPSLGGTRIHAYSSPQDALQDVLRLAKAMTYKSAIAKDGLGGGKSVLIANPRKDKTPQLLRAFGEVVDTLKGKYIAAEDVGTSPEDMNFIRESTPYVAALMIEKSSGDPSRFTASGVFRGIQAVGKKLWRSKFLRGKTVAIQGLGHVGSKLANLLFWEGANLIVCDIDQELAHRHAYEYGARVVSPDEFCTLECDILAPCALGGSINDLSIKQLRCKAIAGAANNQLSSPELGRELSAKKILYAPDYIINSGGIINAAAEFEEGGYDPRFARDRVNHIYDTLIEIFQRAEAENKPTNLVADEIAEYNLIHGIGKRKKPIIFKH